MVRALNRLLVKFIDWFDTACEVCLAVREIVMAIVKIGYSLALIAGLYVIFAWTFDDEPVYNILGVKILTTNPAPGQEFKFAIDVNKTRNCHGFVTRGLGGACGNIDILTVPTTLGVGRTWYELHMRVPADVKPGSICIARIRVTYSCNAWQQLVPVEFVLPEIPFMVGNPPIAPPASDNQPRDDVPK